MSNSKLSERSKPFVDFLETWLNGLDKANLNEITASPEKVAIISTDMINGFCRIGPLASPRVEALIEPITTLFKSAWARGVHNIILAQDTHDPEAVEFEAYPPHCVRGTEEAEAVDEIKALPFFDRMLVFEKNTISSNLNTELDAWIESHSEVDTFIIVGDCTDICVYQMAMTLRLQANVDALKRRVLVPQNCVDTFDTPVELANELGILPHDGDLLHHVFLYHLALNGVEIVTGLEL